jgi:hypothetical protein
MTVGKATALTAGFIAAFAAGVWIGPHMTHRWSATASQSMAAPEAQAANPSSQPSTATAAAKTTRQKTMTRPTEVASVATTMSPSAPEVQRRLKPLLKSGVNMQVAAEGFSSAEQFAAVAHAAKNTDVPFMVLKHRVLNEGKPLSTAIRESKPDINVAAEASLARAEARKDIESL